MFAVPFSGRIPKRAFGRLPWVEQSGAPFAIGGTVAATRSALLRCTVANHLNISKYYSALALADDTRALRNACKKKR
jgi:hypothetical protein